ncbi:hypothetical protein TRFO_35688 [Tritrichomonas foetus]|uniref:Uncharacterized protein n=1 Tax=Tritrichomonas foetus TaxID=1144522 RepID=A0A1J4JFL1_9EUKA|nr:hypothetical protein TRFO_35688 [Tritrichomonas foetus]|eukprot:OHS98006.1 hypothetical protein TRFO_35688 [Tritrichomonas foetus]
MDPSNIYTDLRKWEVGGWQSSKMSAKVNGRWTYFFPKDGHQPLNRREPIHFCDGYKPPNHVKSEFQNYPKIDVHPYRKQRVLTHLKQKAPLVFSSPQNLSTHRSTSLKPTAWESNISHIPQMKIYPSNLKGKSETANHDHICTQNYSDSLKKDDFDACQMKNLPTSKIEANDDHEIFNLKVKPLAKTNVVTPRYRPVTQFSVKESNK